MTVIAIDFGTKYSSVAARSQNGWVYTLPDDHGKIRISSCVAFHEDGVRVGNLADLKRHANVENTIFDIKTLLGLNFERAVGLKEKYNWPFKVVNDGEQRPKLEVQYLGSTVSYYPEEILAIFLNHLVQIAEKRLRTVQVSGVVITVPVSFNHLKRKAIDNAARIAGINLKALVNDTTAAAIYYSIIPQHAKKTMIIHIGAGSLAVSICHVTDNGITVKFTDGELSLGGRDINRAMINEMKPSREVTNLHKLIEEVKISFCQPTKMNSQIELEYRRGKKEMKTIPRQAYEQACGPIRDRLKLAINQSKKWCHHERVSKVILIGGSTRLPLVEQLLTDMNLNKRIEMTGIKADEIVALGAGMLAAQYVESDLLKNHFPIKDVLTYSVSDVERNLLVSKNTLLSECQERAKQPIKSNEVLKIIEVAGNVAIISKTLSADDLKSAIIITDNGLISVNRGKSKVADGLSENMINKLIRQQNQLSRGTAVREATEKEKYHLEKQSLDVKKEMKKMWKKCDATEELIDKETDLSLAGVQKERKEFREFFLHWFGNMKVIMCSEEELSTTDDYVKKLETDYTSLNDQLQSEKNRCQSLDSDLQAMSNRCQSLENILQAEREGNKRQSTSQKEALQTVEIHCQSLQDKLQAALEKNQRESTHNKSMRKELQAEKNRNRSLERKLESEQYRCELQNKQQMEIEELKQKLTHYKSRNDELQSGKNRCKSLNRDLQTKRNRCPSMDDKLQTEKKRRKRESTHSKTLNEALEAGNNQSQSLESELDSEQRELQNIQQMEMEKTNYKSLEDQRQTEKNRIKSMDDTLQADKNRSESLRQELKEERSKKHEMTPYQLLNEDLQSEKKQCQSLNKDLQKLRNRCRSLQDKLQKEKEKNEHESRHYKSLADQLQTERNRSKSMNDALQDEKNRTESLRQELKEERSKKRGMPYVSDKPITSQISSSQSSNTYEKRPLLNETVPTCEARKFRSGEDSRNIFNENTGSVPRRTLRQLISDSWRWLRERCC